MGKNSKKDNKASSSTRPPLQTWGPADDEALRVVVNSLNHYYSATSTKNIPQRSRKLATYKIFGSWDLGDDDNDNARSLRTVVSEGGEPNDDNDNDPWRRFCRDMTCLDNDDERSQKFDEAQEEVENANARIPSSVGIWPVAIVKHKYLQHSNSSDDDAMMRRHPQDDNHQNNGVGSHTSCIKALTSRPSSRRHYGKKHPHVDVIFANQDANRCTYGVEVCSTPLEKVRDVYARNNLAKF